MELALLTLAVGFRYVGSFVSQQAHAAEGGAAAAPKLPTVLLQAVNDVGGDSSLLALLLVVLTGTIAAQEYGWRTLHLWFGRGVPRGKLLLAKFSSILVPTLLFLLTPIVIVLPLALYFIPQLGGTLTITAGEVGEVAASLPRDAFVALPYVALTFLVAVGTRSTIAAIGVGVGYALVVEHAVMRVAQWARPGRDS